MIIPFTGIQASIRCSDGKCYPILFLGMATSSQFLMPLVEVRFIKDKPEFIHSSKIVVNMLSINFGGNNVEKEF